MRFCAAVAILLLLSGVARAQGPTKEKDKRTHPAEPKVVTVPAVIDHNRVIIDVDIPVPPGIIRGVRAWVDPGLAFPKMSMGLSRMIGGSICLEDAGEDACTGLAPPKVVIGGMEIPFDDKFANIHPSDNHEGSSVDRGVNAEISIPSTVLRHYDVLIDCPGRKVTIGTPGSIHFNGVSAKVQINPNTGVITVPSKIDNKKYDLQLDLGSPMSSLSADLFDALATAHPDWPQMTGAIGPASESDSDQVKRRVMRLDRLQFGPLFLTNVAVTALAKTTIKIPGRVANPVTEAGLLGSEALQNYRVGIDYAHSMVYFDIGRLSNFPDFDVIGLILQPEDDGRYKILGIADFEGKPSLPSGPDGVQPGDYLVAVDEIPVQAVTMGQVWSMLGGTPGQERKLTIEREGRQSVVAASVRHFLAEAPDDSDTKKRK